MRVNQAVVDMLERAIDSPDDNIRADAYQIIARLDHPFYKFRPRTDSTGDEQTRFVNDDFNGVQVVRSGNGAGKSYVCAYKLVKLCLDNEPPVNLCPIWICSQTLEMTAKNCWGQALKHFLPEDQIESISWYNKVLGYPKAVVLRPHPNGNRFVLEFKSYDMSREGLQGTNIFSLWCDEQIELSLFNELLARTRKWEQPKFYTLTPLTPDPELQNRFANPPKSWRWYAFDTRQAAKAGHIQQSYISLIEENECAELIETRLSGAFASWAGQIYPMFSAKNIMEPQPIPTGFRRCRGLDLGWQDHTVCLFAAQSPDGIWWIYKEYVANQKLIRQHVEEINKDWHYDHPAYGMTYCDHDPQDLHEYQDRGLKNVRNTWKESVTVGISLVQHLFADGKLKVFSSCPKLINSLRNYCWDKKKEGKPNHDYSDCCDSLRYLIASETFNVQPLKKDEAKPSFKQSYNPYQQRLERNPYS